MNQHRSRRRSLTGLVVASLFVASGLASVVLATGTSASASSSASLSVSPGNYVGGQRLTWTGNVGHTGERTLVLQFNMGGVTGNTWDTVEGFSARTRADGSFSFTYPAPSMFNILYRVKAGDYVTPARTFNAKTQDLTIRLTGHPADSTNPAAHVAVGQPFGITVDTTPDNIFRQPDSQGLPVFAGRPLTLQKRVDGTTWSTVATSVVGADGSGYFAGLQEDAGIAVYRVRQENWFADGNAVGWTQSFPLYVLVGPDAQQWYAGRRTAPDSTTAVSTTPVRLGAQSTTASQRFAWFPSLFDFAWEHGQSLSSPPARGTRIQGGWVDYSDGAGRVAKYNGGLSIDSKRYWGAGPGDFGTTRATLQGNAMTQGRWETSLRIRNAFERGGRSYKVLAELVPAEASDYDCGQHNITMASISPFSHEVRFGVRSPESRWSGATTAAYTPLSNAYNVAVEITGNHITWFLNSSPVASVVNPEALPGVPMTLRLSLVGDRRAEMDQVGLISDWQRGFPVDTGQQSVSGTRLPRADAAPIDCPAG